MTYPKTPRDWEKAVQDGLGISPEVGRAAYRAACRHGDFPFQVFEAWLRRTYSEGYSPDFLPALLRNQRGLVAWVYGEGEEPYWRGSDEGHDAA